MVHDGEDRIVGPIRREVGDEVHGDLLEGLSVFPSWYFVERVTESVRDNLRLLAGGAACYVVGDPGLHPGPPELSRGGSVRFVSSGVSS